VTGEPQTGTPTELVMTSLFESHLAAIDESDRVAVKETLDRVRCGKEAMGVERPWGRGSAWTRWPAGAYKVVVRPLQPSEVIAALGGETRAGFLLVVLDPPPV
jgi:hypothetical protein